MPDAFRGTFPGNSPVLIFYSTGQYFLVLASKSIWRVSRRVSQAWRLRRSKIIFFKTAQTTAALTRLKPVWNDRSISLSSKIQVMRSIVTSIFFCACESWTLTLELQRRIQAIEMRYYRKILRISYKDRATNEEVRAKRTKTSSPS